MVYTIGLMSGIDALDKCKLYLNGNTKNKLFFKIGN
jgi:hypothetical protein